VPPVLGLLRTDRQLTWPWQRRRAQQRRGRRQTRDRRVTVERELRTIRAVWKKQGEHEGGRAFVSSLIRPKGGTAMPGRRGKNHRCHCPPWSGWAMPVIVRGRWKAARGRAWRTSSASRGPERDERLRELLLLELHYRRGAARCRPPTSITTSSRRARSRSLAPGRRAPGAAPRVGGPVPGVLRRTRPPGATGERLRRADRASRPYPLDGIRPPAPAGLSAAADPGYEVLGELAGEQGHRLQARQVQANRPVALKVILAGGQAGEAELARVRTEGEAVARLQHPTSSRSTKSASTKVGPSSPSNTAPAAALTGS